MQARARVGPRPCGIVADFSVAAGHALADARSLDRTRASAERARSRIQAAHDPRPGVRATASTITLSAPAANRPGRRPRRCCPWSSRRPPTPRAGRARPARETRQPGRRGARAGPAACRGVSRRRSSAPGRSGRSSAVARLRAISMAGFMPRRRSEARLAGTAASTASAGRGASRATAAPAGAPAPAPATGAAGSSTDRSGPRPAARSRMPRWRAGRRAAGSGSPRTAGRLAQALRAARTTRARLTAATGDVGLAARAQARAPHPRAAQRTIAAHGRCQPRPQLSAGAS